VAVTQTEVEIVEAVLGRLEGEKSSWTVANVMQVTWQVMERDGDTTAEADEARAQRCIDAVLGYGEVVKLTPTLDVDLPVELLRGGRRVGVRGPPFGTVCDVQCAQRGAVSGGSVPVADDQAGTGRVDRGAHGGGVRSAEDDHDGGGVGGVAGQQRDRSRVGGHADGGERVGAGDRRKS
jgi:hypothetical protein